MSQKILIIAGEASSDIHTSNLVREIKRLRPGIEFYGLGGKNMKNAGVDILYNIVELAVVGFVEVLRHYSAFKKIFHELLERAKADRPSLVILVDYPGFNLMFAREIKKLNIPIIYYISPQVWAWGKGRIKLIRKLIDRMLVIFKFEEKLYKDENVNVSFVGHPLLDIIPSSFDKNRVLNEFGISSKDKAIALMPGSRQSEVRQILPIMLGAASIIQKDAGPVSFLIVKSPTLGNNIYEDILKRYNLPVRIVEGKNYDIINAAGVVLVASGTATLETAILRRPMIIVYKVAFITYIFSRLMIKLPFIGMPNIISGKKIVQEFIQYNAKPQLIAKEAIKILSDSSYSDSIINNLSDIKASLGEGNTAQKAAGIIVDFLEKR